MNMLKYISTSLFICQTSLAFDLPAERTQDVETTNRLQINGHVVGNGGNFLELKFLLALDKIIYYLNDPRNQKEAQIILDTKNIEDLEQVAELAVVNLTDEILIDALGRTVDATVTWQKSTPFPLITLYRAAWTEAYHDRDLFHIMVLHEALRAAGVPDENYIYSRRLQTDRLLATGAWPPSRYN